MFRRYCFEEIGFPWLWYRHLTSASLCVVYLQVKHSLTSNKQHSCCCCWMRGCQELENHTLKKWSSVSYTKYLTSHSTVNLLLLSACRLKSLCDMPIKWVCQSDNACFPGIWHKHFYDFMHTQHGTLTRLVFMSILWLNNIQSCVLCWCCTVEQPVIIYGVENIRRAFRGQVGAYLWAKVTGY